MVFRRDIFTALVSGVLMVSLVSCSSNGFKYEKYTAKDPMLGLKVEYIKGWMHGESRGSNNSYAEVFFGEPAKDKSTSFKPFMNILVRDIALLGAGSKDLDGIADIIISKNIKIHRASEVSLPRARIKLPAGEAVDSSFEFETLDKIYSVGNSKIKVIEREVVLLKDSKAYILSYRNRQEDFSKYSKAFDHFIRSLRFEQVSP